MTLKKAPYVLAFCKASEDLKPSLLGRLAFMGNTDFEAANVIHSVIQFSPAAESVAIEFLDEFSRVPQLDCLVTPVLTGQASIADSDTHQWAQYVLNALRVLDREELATALKPVLDLASDYLIHLLIAVRNPGGIKTPLVSASDSPEVLPSSAEITTLIDQATNTTSQTALKRLVFARDGYNCPLTEYSFDPTATWAKRAECPHIIPLSLHDKALSLRMIESFAGHQFTAQDIIANINHPQNVFHVERDAHDFFDELNWGIEAEYVNDQIKYIYRQLIEGNPKPICRSDGDELSFNHGTKGDMIDGPNPRYCNLRLAIARAYHACGAAEIIRKIYASYDDDDFVLQPTYFGGPFVPDEDLYLRLHSRLASYV